MPARRRERRAARCERCETLARVGRCQQVAQPIGPRIERLRFQLVDQACDGLLGVYLFYKGLQTISTARIASYYWREAGGHGKQIARLLQSEMADVFGVDIHPGARMHAHARVRIRRAIIC